MDIFDSIPKKGLKFNHRGTPLDPELRPLWRISLLILILSNLCAGGKANSKKIQALYSLVSSEKKRKAYPGDGENAHQNASINIRFDPLVDRAVDMGVGYGFFELDESKRICLTQKGKNFGKKIQADSNLFIIENNYMKNFQKSHFTEQAITSLIAGDLL
ncbi:hypothetical protein TUM4438_43340 [Shewanella sairae]|uniref:Uncharacterized protein n=1 Tax=Shewanella sairae TaxID=190310 RepID=A0ABQ4PR69_9GAMM|nr:hypothetical protein [Shewanella sairae]MCL1131649.1 hypothetical protein [Shewanella sairae]GIU51957.1 hypothetical protein TUM4438_43340 [Shewanella sairae]